mmetsp:Transcript_34822/g.81577  ORF Transcript_34822/g.81577 Transcript_34822/m.81577 type:complete len:223 (-) Transcript_34822:168-836(-)
MLLMLRRMSVVASAARQPWKKRRARASARCLIARCAAARLSCTTAGRRACGTVLHWPVLLLHAPLTLRPVLFLGSGVPGADSGAASCAGAVSSSAAVRAWSESVPLHATRSGLPSAPPPAAAGWRRSGEEELTVALVKSSCSRSTSSCKRCISSFASTSCSRSWTTIACDARSCVGDAFSSSGAHSTEASVCAATSTYTAASQRSASEAPVWAGPKGLSSVG